MVHSFIHFVPLEKYWDTHPEYYSMVDGKRLRDWIQLCMTNKDLPKIISERILELLRKDPNIKIVCGDLFLERAIKPKLGWWR